MSSNTKNGVANPNPSSAPSPANADNSGSSNTTAIPPMERDMNLGEWILHENERTISSANRMSSEMENFKTDWLNRHLPQMVAGNPREGRLAVDSTRVIYRSITKHIEELQLIAAGIKEEMVSRYPQLDADFEGLTPYRPWITTAAPTPPREEIISQSIPRRSRRNNQNILRLYTSTIATATGTANATTRSQEDMFRDTAEGSSAIDRVPAQSTIPREDPAFDSSTDDDRTSSPDSEKSNATMIVPTRTENREGKENVHLPVTFTETVQRPLEDGLENISEDEDDVSIPETEIISPNESLIQNTDQGHRQNVLSSTKISETPPAADETQVTSNSQDEMEISNENENSAGSALEEVLPSHDMDIVARDPDSESEVISSSQAVAMEFPGESDEVNAEIGDDNFDDFRPVIISVRTQAVLPNVSTSSQELDGDISLKTENVTSSQESDFQPCTPYCARLFRNPNDLETVDDELPSTSSQFLENNSNSNSRDPMGLGDLDLESTDEEGGEANRRRFRASVADQHSSLNHFFRKYIDADPKLRGDACQVRMERLAAGTLEVLREYNYIIDRDRAPDNNSEVDDETIENDYPVDRGQPRKSRAQNPGTVESAVEKALKKLDGGVPERRKPPGTPNIPRIPKKRKPRISGAVPPDDSGSGASSDSDDKDSENDPDDDDDENPEDEDTLDEEEFAARNAIGVSSPDHSDDSTIGDDDEEDDLSCGENDARASILINDTPRRIQPVAVVLPMARKRTGKLNYNTPRVGSTERGSPPRRRLIPRIESYSTDSSTDMEDSVRLNEPIPIPMSDSDDDDVVLTKPDPTAPRVTCIKSSSSDEQESPESDSGSSESAFPADEDEIGRTLTKRKQDSSSSTGDNRNERRPRKRIRQNSESSSTTSSSDNMEVQQEQEEITLSDSDSDVEEVPMSASSQYSLSSQRSKRRTIRPIMDDRLLSESTRAAELEEKNRISRLKKRKKEINDVIQTGLRIIEDTSNVEDLILDVNADNEPIIKVDKSILLKFKPHQREGLKFMWETCIESAAYAKERPGTGCIIAHCMGLGKTVQALGLIHTVLTHEILNFKSALVVCPMNTITNWCDECNCWLKSTSKNIETYDLSQHTGYTEKTLEILTKWGESGGLGIIHYDRFKKYWSDVQTLMNPPASAPATSTPENADAPTTTDTPATVANGEMLQLIKKVFFNPGPDIIVFDEGHLLKNHRTTKTRAANNVQTKRRIILTGTPLQNNLIEYYTMVSLVKPNLLGTRIEFANRFRNPIDQGAHLDSTEEEIAIMKGRSHVLHTKLEGVVQRYDFSELKPYLPEKHEYTIYVQFSEAQKELYTFYTARRKKEAIDAGEEPNKYVMSMYCGDISRISAHPSLILTARAKRINDNIPAKIKRKPGRPRRSDSNCNLPGPSVSVSNPSVTTLEDVDNSSDSSTDVEYICSEPPGMSSRDQNKPIPPAIDEILDAPENSWCKPFLEEKEKYFGVVKKSVDEDDRNKINTEIDIELSGKLVIVKEIIKVCEQIDDKLLIFSQFLNTLNLIEDMLKQWDNERKVEDGNAFTEGLRGVSGRRWRLNQEYFRIDGNTNIRDRKNSTDNFNKGAASKAKVFLISTKAGGLGINLCGANRVIIFDVSWNPAQDLQSIFRVYRLGQTKPCYIYRLLSHRTLEEKIYNNQVKKLSLAGRVVDEQIIANFFNKDQGENVYMYDDRTDPSEHDSSSTEAPKDRLLADLIESQKKWIYRYREHDTLLEDRKDEVLTEAERSAAMAEYENEEQNKPTNARSKRRGGSQGQSLNSGSPRSKKAPMQARNLTDVPDGTTTQLQLPFLPQPLLLESVPQPQPESVPQPEPESVPQQQPESVPQPQPVLNGHPPPPKDAFRELLEKKYFTLNPSSTNETLQMALQDFIDANQIMNEIKCGKRRLDKATADLITKLSKHFGADIQWVCVLGDKWIRVPQLGF